MPALVDNTSSLNEHLLVDDESSSAAEQTPLTSSSSAVQPTTMMVTNNNEEDELNNSHHSDPVVLRRPTRLTQARSFWEEHCVYLPAMLGWFLFSALLSSYNKVRWSSSDALVD